MKPLPPKVRWTGSPIEVAIALGLLGPAWLETDDDAEKKLSRSVPVTARIRCACGEWATRAADDGGSDLHLCRKHYLFWVGERKTIELEQARWSLAESMAADEEPDRYRGNRDIEYLKGGGR
jgi:predicted DNA-binding ribbon-helix-helix protein